MSQQEVQADKQADTQGEQVADTIDLASDSSSSFVNTGLQQWERAREHWLGHGMKSSDTDSSTTHKVAVPLEVDEIIDVIFSPRWRQPGVENLEEPPRRFPQNVPLPQMVDVLVDLWEAEGLDI